MFDDIPVQLCQFHQVKTVSRYLTRNPKTDAGKALWRLALTLKNSRQSDFERNLQTWFEQYQSYLNERTFNIETGKSHYTHKNIRSAYYGIWLTCLCLSVILICAFRIRPICLTARSRT